MKRKAEKGFVRSISRSTSAQAFADDLPVVALAGNPNVGKSTVFNALTGMHQHTGNWPGKTVTRAEGVCKTSSGDFLLVDLPGTYSLTAHSAEEEVTRSFVCFSDPHAVVVVCDATCPERNLNLALQILECGKRVILCLNLADEARKKGIHVHLPTLEKELGIPVAETVARKKKTLSGLRQAIAGACLQTDSPPPPPIPYPDALEREIEALIPLLEQLGAVSPTPRWIALRLLENDPRWIEEIKKALGTDLSQNQQLQSALQSAWSRLEAASLPPAVLADIIGNAAVARAEEICRRAVTYEHGQYSELDRNLDRLLTGKKTAFPVMLLLLSLILWITVSGANYPSQWLSACFDLLIGGISSLLRDLGVPHWLHGMTVDGILRIPAWVVSVMLPPMAIFFPLFTLLEDAGYLPRVAYNLDRPFHACRACGKQALTMCMGLGCNAAGVVGCRIIDSPRERLLATVTNSLMPCNGRFPALIAILSMLMIGASGGIASSLLSALLLTLLIALAVGMTLLTTRLLSATLLRGVPSSFTLEMPPFRPPQIGRVLVRSVFDRTLFVLGRALAVAAPAGLVIWLLANLTLGEATLLAHCAAFLDPFARLLGMDGIILLAFILGFPANEIVIPIILMGYLGQGSLSDSGQLAQAADLLAQNGWTSVTALCVLVFFLFHWPCSTTLLTVKKETGSLKWTVLAAILPTLCGMLLCLLIRTAATVFGIP